MKFSSMAPKSKYVSDGLLFFEIQLVSDDIINNSKQKDFLSFF